MSPWLPPTRFAAEDLDPLRLIATRLETGRFELAGQTWRFTMTPLSAHEAAPLPARTRFVEIAWGGARLTLVAPADFVTLVHAHAHAHAAGGERLDALPSALAAAALDAACAELCDGLEHLSGRRVELLGAGEGLPPEAADEAATEAATEAGNSFKPGSCRFAVQLDSDAAGDGQQVLLIADAAALSLLALLARRRPIPERGAPDPAQPLRIRFELSEVLLTPMQLNRLAPHDVLLPDRPIDPARPLLRLRPDAHHVLTVRLDADGLTVERGLTRTFMDMTEDPSGEQIGNHVGDHGADDTPGRIEDIQLRVSFDLGDRLMTVGELAALRPGQMVAADLEPSRLVAVRANGRLIGRGELVRVDNQVGIRLLGLSSALLSPRAAVASEVEGSGAPA